MVCRGFVVLIFLNCQLKQKWQLSLFLSLSVSVINDSSIQPDASFRPIERHHQRGDLPFDLPSLSFRVLKRRMTSAFSSKGSNALKPSLSKLKQRALLHYRTAFRTTTSGLNFCENAIKGLLKNPSANELRQNLLLTSMVDHNLLDHVNLRPSRLFAKNL